MSLLILILGLAHAEYVCTIDTGAAKEKYRGKDHKDAMTKIVGACMRSMKEDYILKYKRLPNTERKIIHLEYCLNNTYCRRIK